MSYEMLYLNVLVKPDEVSQQEVMSAGGIFIPTMGQIQDPTTGTVVAVGPGMLTDFGTFVEPTVKVGDKVLFRSFQMGFEVKQDGQKYIVFNNRDIMGIVK